MIISGSWGRPREALGSKKVLRMKLPESTQGHLKNRSRTSLSKGLFSSKVSVLRKFSKCSADFFLTHFISPQKTRSQNRTSLKLVSLVAIIPSVFVTRFGGDLGPGTFQLIWLRRGDISCSGRSGGPKRSIIVWSARPGNILCFSSP